MKKKKIINIIGTGICGLSVALQMKETFKDEIEIIITSNKEIEDTTSYIAGGLWEPYCYGETLQEDIIKWSTFTYKLYEQLFTSIEVLNTGIQQLSVYNFTEEFEEPFWKDIPTIYQQLTIDQLKRLKAPSNCHYGYTFLSFVAEPRFFLFWLKEKLLQHQGVTWETKNVNFIDEQIYNPISTNENQFYDIVINCTGLGSKELLNDSECYPIRGQILHIKAPWITSSWTFGKYYLIPNRDVVIVGGTAQYNDWNLEVSEEDTENIWKNVCEVFPSIQNAPIVKTLVGLRPARTTVQLNSERIVLSTNENQVRNVLLVNCYGVGGCGFTIGPGLANDVLLNHIVPFLQNNNEVN